MEYFILSSFDMWHQYFQFEDHLSPLEVVAIVGASLSRSGHHLHRKPHLPYCAPTLAHHLEAELDEEWCRCQEIEPEATTAAQQH